jgi:hypothetical protein
MLAYSLSLQNKFVTNVPASVKEPVSLLFTFEQTCFAFLGHAHDGLYHWHCCLISASYLSARISSSMIISKWNFGSLSSRVDGTFPLLTYQARHKWSVNAMHFQIIFHNALNWPKWYPQHVSNFTNNAASIFKEKFLHSVYIFVCFAHWWPNLA